MITLITAVPGSGKSLYMVGRILKWLEEGRAVYANINGLNIPGVHPSPDDWRDTPEGSVVIYDECQEPHLYPSNAKPGEVTDPRLKAMEKHRHTGHDLVFATQSPTFVHHHVRKLVGEHIHLYRPNGMQGANIYTWSGFACTDPNDRREQERADHQLWKFPREHFNLYKSATVHTHKFRFPRKIGILLGIIALGFSVVAYSLSDGFKTLSSPEPDAAAERAGEAPAPLPVSSWPSSIRWRSPASPP